MSAFTPRIQVHLNRRENGNFMSGARQRLIGCGDLARLFAELRFVNSTGNLKALRMICNRDVFVTGGARRFSHFDNSARAVAPLGMHLEIAAQRLSPIRPGREQSACIRQGQKIAAQRGRRQRCGRIPDPLLDLLRDEGANAMKLGQLTPARNEIRRRFRPEKRTAGRSPESADQNSFALLCFPRKKFGQV
jgi:hypothetical protein